MKQGEIWLINPDPTVGADIKETRPAIIVNDNALGKLPLKIIVPVKDWKDRYGTAPWMTRLEPFGASASCYLLNRAGDSDEAHNPLMRL